MSDGRLIPLRLARWWDLLRASGERHEVDPLLLAAIMDRESNGGDALTPRGPAGTGDFKKRPHSPFAGGNGLPVDGAGGWGRGLMQVDFAAHNKFCTTALRSGTPAWQSPGLNIDYAAKLLAELLKHFDGVECKAIAAYNAGTHAVESICAELTQPLYPPELVAACNAVTTGYDYVSSVTDKRKLYVIQRKAEDEEDKTPTDFSPKGAA